MVFQFYLRTIIHYIPKPSFLYIVNMHAMTKMEIKHLWIIILTFTCYSSNSKYKTYLGSWSGPKYIRSNLFYFLSISSHIIVIGMPLTIINGWEG